MMIWKIRALLAVLVMLFAVTGAMAAGPVHYAPAKVVYDFSSADPEQLTNLLDRISMLQNIYAGDPFVASIVVVMHDGAIPLMANRTRQARPELIQRARGLTLGSIIDFRLCQASARVQGFGPQDFDSFVRLVPMADAEIVRLQHEGYAYLN